MHLFFAHGYLIVERQIHQSYSTCRFLTENLLNNTQILGRVLTKKRIKQCTPTSDCRLSDTQNSGRKNEARAWADLKILIICPISLGWFNWNCTWNNGTMVRKSIFTISKFILSFVPAVINKYTYFFFLFPKREIPASVSKWYIRPLLHYLERFTSQAKPSSRNRNRNKYTYVHFLTVRWVLLDPVVSVLIMSEKWSCWIH